MKNLFGAAAVLAAFVAWPAPAQTTDYQGYKDPALFTRLPHYVLAAETSFTETPFDAYEFTVKNGATQTVEGRHFRYAYEFDESAGARPGLLQIVRNYTAAAKRIGGQVLTEDGRSATIRIVKDGRETWVAVDAYNEGWKYQLNIIEKEAMQQDVVANADALKGGLASTGHVEVPGIFFDTAKSDVKPESDAALKEVVKLLTASPTLRVWVVGHTDSVGTAEANVTLSNARAAAVIQVLTQKMGVSPKRLAPHGAGPFAPVAANTTEEGRARNRRVELVAQP